MTDIKDKVKGITLDHFGQDLGTWLCDNNYIIPVDDDKQPYKIKSWKSFYFFNYGYLDELPPGLAVVMNPRLNVLDIDDKEHVTGNPNVLTTKGAHYWFVPDESTPRKTQYQRTFDLKVSGYVIFWGKGKEFHHSNILPWCEVEKFLPRRPPPLHESDVLLTRIDSTDKREGLSVGINTTTISNYVELVQGSSIGDFDLTIASEKVTQQYLTQIANTSEGKRNVTLFRIALEFYRLNLDLDKLADSAYKAGLDYREIQGTIASAGASFDIDPGISVLERVLVWHNIASGFMTTGQQRTILDYVAFRAVEDNSLAPLVNQTRLAELKSLNQQAVSKTLNRGFCEKWGEVPQQKWTPGLCGLTGLR